MSRYNGYKPEDNARRKANNTGEQLDGVGPNFKVKSYSSKPGQLSAEDQAALIAKEQYKKNRNSPVKQLTAEEIQNVKLSPAKPPKKRKPKRPVVLMTDEQFNEMMAKLKRGY